MSKFATKQISIPEIVIQSFDYNAGENKHFNNRKGTNVLKTFYEYIDANEQL